jgi:surface antigen
MNSSIKTRIVGAALAAGIVLGGVLVPAVAEAAVPVQPAGAVSVMGTPAEDGAVAWAQGQLGSDGYNGYCLQFVYDAYSAAGLDIGAAPSAVDWWNANPDRQHVGDTNPPEGALVFWGATSTNPYGHVAISEGGDTLISSAERSSTDIHEFSLADRNAGGYPYLGWILPD